MINYFQIESASITKLKEEWEKFIDDCYEEVDRQYYEDSKSYEKEAREDRFYERYDEDSINEWYRDSIKNLDEWAESMKDKFRDTYRKGKQIIDEIANKKFYDDETGYKFILNFCDGKIEREYNDDTYCIVFSGMTWTIDDVTIEFDPSSPEYTEWMPVRSR